MGIVEEYEEITRTYYKFKVEIERMSSNMLVALIDCLTDERIRSVDIRIERTGYFVEEENETAYTHYTITFDTTRMDLYNCVCELGELLYSMDEYADHSNAGAFTEILCTLNYANRFDGERVRDSSSYSHILGDSDVEQID